MIRAVSFDCAQTLLDVNWSPGDFARLCSERVGLEIPDGAEAVYESLLADRGADYFAASKSPNPDATAAFWRTLTQDWLRTLEVSGSPDELMSAGEELMYGSPSAVYRLYPDTLPCLQALENRGVPMIVLSNWDNSLHKVLQKFGLSAYFQHVFASMVEGCAKPDPKFFRIGHAALGLEASEVLHIGDNPYDDGEGALEVGSPCLIINRDGGGDIVSLEQILDRLS